MLPKETIEWGSSRSCIRELAEYGAQRKAQIGADRVYDFSLGNPSVPAPECVDSSIIDIINDPSIHAHAYTTAAGLFSLRQRLADELNNRYGLSLKPELFYVTCGAAASLTISLRAVLLPQDEVIVIAPFFPEYRVYVEGQGGILRTVPPAKDFTVDLEAFEKAINKNTKAVIINSPNNPTGAVLDEQHIKDIAEILKRHERENKSPIYLISDEPYREIVYDGLSVPCTLKYYDNSIMCYSFSKALSVPGERIGYIAVNDRMQDADTVYASVLGAGRALGYINPPSLFQRVIERCAGKTSDISEYAENRRLLMNMLDEIGYEYIKPQGAFYLFMKALEPDAVKFSERARKHELLLVPSDDFGCEGYVRIAYCVDSSVIRNAKPAFKALYDEYSK